MSLKHCYSVGVNDRDIFHGLTLRQARLRALACSRDNMGTIFRVIDTSKRTKHGVGFAPTVAKYFRGELKPLDFC